MKIKFLILAGLCISFTIVFTSCATIASKSVYPLYIRTQPKGADIVVMNRDGKKVFVGNSPATVSLRSGAGFFIRAKYKVIISAPGYEEKILPLNFKLNGWYLGNFLIGGVIGFLIVDPATGAMWRLSDPLIDEKLIKSTSATSMVPTLEIIDIASIPAHYRQKLLQIK